jgi:hypothetical protein
MEAYCAEVRKLKAKFDGLELCHIPRRDNEEADSLKEADSLTRIGSTRDMPLGDVFLDELTRPSARWEVETQPPPEPSMLTITKAVSYNRNWAQELINYL